MNNVISFFIGCAVLTTTVALYVLYVTLKQRYKKFRCDWYELIDYSRKTRHMTDLIFKNTGGFQDDGKK